MLQEFKKIENFYPTPDFLIDKMIEKVNFSKVKYILEPSAGKGDIIKKLIKKTYHRIEVNAIEINSELQAVLRGEGYQVIDTDFLSHMGGEMYDLIIANPPFIEGEHHLLKAIDLMYNEQIVFLLNAETLKNPYTKYRQLLKSKLEKLNADIEYFENTFIDSERKTEVEIALIYINIEREIGDELFKDMKEKEDIIDNLKGEFEIARKDDIHNIVQEYNRTIEKGIETLRIYYQNSPLLYKFIRLNHSKSTYSRYKWQEIKEEYQEQVYEFYQSVRKYFWEKALNIPEIKKNLTSEKVNEFRDKLNDYAYMEFSESNIRQFILNIKANYLTTIKESIIALFDKITREYSWSPETEQNRLYFTSWKSNNAYKVNKKFILPFYSDTFCSTDWSTQKRYWKLSYLPDLDDIDKVINYFDGLNSSYLPIREAIEEAFYFQQNRKIKSTYFEISVFKKGTLHLTILDEGILRRFNIEACKDKNWLPHNYSTKEYKDLSDEEREIVESFEGKDSYIKNFHNNGLATKEDEQLLLFG